jgi:hypothetical protein
VGALVEAVFPFHSWQIVNGVIFLTACTYFITSKEIQLTVKDGLFLLPILLILFFNRSYISTLSPDLTANFFVIGSFYFAYNAEKTQGWTRFYNYLIPIGAIMLWNKLTSISVIIVFGLLLIHLLRTKAVRFADISRFSMFSAVIIIICMLATNVISSGYLIYPITSLAIESEWTLPVNRAEALRTHIRLWGIDPSYELMHDYSGFWWIPTWIMRNMYGGIYHLETTLLLLSPLFLITLFWKSKSPVLRYWLPAGFLIHIVIWFLGSPNMRFIGVWLYLLAGLSTWLFLQMSFKPTVVKYLTSFCILYVLVHTAIESGPRSKLLEGPRTNLLFPLPPPSVNYEPHQLDDQTVVNVPTGKKQIWYTPFPCSRQLPVHAFSGKGGGFYPSASAFQLSTVY